MQNQGTTRTLQPLASSPRRLSMPQRASFVSIDLPNPATLARLTTNYTAAPIQVDEPTASASGEFLGTLQISNVITGFRIGEQACGFRLNGPWDTSTITKHDGSAWVMGELWEVDGTMWYVWKIDEDEFGVYGVHFYALNHLIRGNVIYDLPEAIYSGTYTPGLPTRRNPLKPEIYTSVATINNGFTKAVSTAWPLV